MQQLLFNLQGHRGARGLRPENSLPAFENAFDLGVTSIETDVHLSRDGVPVIIHDPVLNAAFCRLVSEKMDGSPGPDPAVPPAVSALTLEQLRRYRVDKNPDARRFPEQSPARTPLARLFAEGHGIDPYAPPALADLFAFAGAYAGALGVETRKTEDQRKRAGQVRFDLELKRVPFRASAIGAEGEATALFERKVLEQVHAAGVAERTTVRSFDHRSVRLLRQLEPKLEGAVLVAGTAPLAPARLAQDADAQVYCPDFEFLDQSLVRQAHAEGIRVLPWTVNDPDDWLRLIDWGVDGITTDYPDRLARLLQDRHIYF